MRQSEHPTKCRYMAYWHLLRSSRNLRHGPNTPR